MTKIITKYRTQELSHPTANVYIKSAKGKVFEVICSAYHSQSEVKNMQYHLSQAVSKPSLYDFIDVDSAKIIVETDLPELPNMTDAELLEELGV